MIRVMDTLIILAAAAVGFWLFATWFTADDQPVLGPALPGRVTFKDVLQGAMRDTRDLLKLDLICRWLITNATALGVFLSTLVSLADPVLRTAILTANWNGIPVGALALLLVSWLATLKPVTR
ncbi:MAG: hypothetical protein NW206_19830 [Hyphomonadaceae bacterium]|nr:hypothetical protein [Hyphomonadaceae bacterium]